LQEALFFLGLYVLAVVVFAFVVVKSDVLIWL
jgi:hypothetical protein